MTAREREIENAAGWIGFACGVVAGTWVVSIVALCLR